MTETLRQKRLKPRLSLTFSYVCLECEFIEEAPVDLKCSTCGLPMDSLSRICKGGVTRQEPESETPVRGDTRPGPQGDDQSNAAFYTEFRTPD